MELEKLLTNLLARLDRIDEEGKGTIIEDKINKLSHQIGQLKSDLSDVATLFDLLKDNKEQIANKITDTDSTSKVSEGTKSSTIGSENTGIESLTLEDIGDIRKEVIKDFKQNIFIGYVKKVTPEHVRIVLDTTQVVNVKYSSKWSKYCAKGTYVAVHRIEYDNMEPNWEIVRFLSAQRNYTITHPEGGKGKFADKKANYKDNQTNQKLHNGQLIDVEVTKIESNYCEVYSAKDNVFAYVPCKEPAYMFKVGNRFRAQIKGYDADNDMYIVKEV